MNFNKFYNEIKQDNALRTLNTFTIRRLYSAYAVICEYSATPIQFNECLELWRYLKASSSL